MTEPSTPIVSPSAWLQLLHAEVSWAFLDAGVRCLVIKGPSVSRWLYEAAESRPSVDVDVIVPPAQWDAAVFALGARAFRATHEGTHPGEIAPHSVELHREDDELGRHSVDLHRYFPGINAPPGDAFELLWGGRVADDQAGIPVWFPGYPARALIVALHAARSPGVRHTQDDLTRMAAWAEVFGWGEVVALGRRLNALTALRAGLELLPDGAAVVGRAGLLDVEVTREWELMSQNAGLTALRLEEFRELPWHRRPGQLTRWLMPSPVIMRYRDPRASESAFGLARAYGVRLGQGMKSLPGAVRAVREARRGR